MRRTVIRVLVAVLLATSQARAFDIDLHLIGYSFLRVEAAERIPGGLLVRLADGTARTIDLDYGYLLGTDGRIDQPRILHVHWLRVTRGGGRANLVSTSAPLIVVAACCFVLDVTLLVRRIRRRPRRESDPDGPSPSAGAR